MLKANSPAPQTKGLSLLQKYLLAISIYVLAVAFWGLPYLFSDPMLVALLLSLPFLAAYLAAYWLHRKNFNGVLTIFIVATVPMLVAGSFWAEVTYSIYEHFFGELPRGPGR